MDREPRTRRRRPARIVPVLLVLMFGIATLSLASPFAAGQTEGTPAAGHGDHEEPSPEPASTSAAVHGGHNTGPVDVTGAPVAPADAQGNQPLDFTLVDGVKEYRLTPQVTVWSILPDVQVGAYAYNGTVPGPLLRLTVGDRVRIVVENRLPDPTSVHWHGLQIDNAQDGAGGITQAPIQPGETFAYEWTVPATPGTFFYHSHVEADRQQALGLYGLLIIEDPASPPPADLIDVPILLGEWTVTDAGTLPAIDAPGFEPNFFTINGKSYPTTETIQVRVGQRVRLRFVGSGQFIHPMHLHGQPFTIVATDGNPVPETARLTKDTVLVGPGERYDVEFVARAPGKWLVHCHINHHVTNNGVEEEGAGGLTLLIEVSA